MFEFPLQRAKKTTPARIVSVKMSASTIQVVSRPKRRGIDLSPYPVEISQEMLISNFHLTVSEAAEKIGIGCTAFKRVCRKFGLKYWPYRKIKLAKIREEKLSKQMEKTLSKQMEKACEEWADSCVLQSPETLPAKPTNHTDQTDHTDHTDHTDQTNHTDFMLVTKGSLDAHSHDIIPDAEDLPLSDPFQDPFQDPFHDDWFMNKVMFYPKFAIFNKIIMNAKQTNAAPQTKIEFLG